jgi:uncharacterized membrane-anchored protein YjiN (DUF445 family)
MTTGMPVEDVFDVDAVRARALARQKSWATALVLLCALVYVVSTAAEGQQPALAYLAAFAEAAVIGALADWYAVVALFRHPFGLKIPHTAIIPANQARIAQNLGEFIAKHFLVGLRVAGRVAQLDPAARAGRWLDEAANRKLVAAYAAELLPQAIEAIDRKMLHGELERSVTERLAEVDMDKLLGLSLYLFTRHRRHHSILDEVLGWVEATLAAPATLGAVRERVRAELPMLFRLYQADALLTPWLVRSTHALMTEVRQDPQHPLRSEFDRFVGEFLDKLRHSPDFRTKAEALKHELLNRPELREILVDAWERFVAWLRQDVAREQGIVRSGIDTFLRDAAARLQHDAALRARVNRWLAESAGALTERYKYEVAAFVAAQMKSWDTRQAVHAIELSIGKDLQYIRVNGTLVGGLLGLAIFTVTTLIKG